MSAVRATAYFTRCWTGFGAKYRSRVARGQHLPAGRRPAAIRPEVGHLPDAEFGNVDQCLVHACERITVSTPASGSGFQAVAIPPIIAASWGSTADTGEGLPVRGKSHQFGGLRLLAHMTRAGGTVTKGS